MTEWFHGEPKIERVEARTFIERWQCPKCKKGDMRATGMTWDMNPPGHHHKCTACGYLAATTYGSYPRTVTVETAEAK